MVEGGWPITATEGRKIVPKKRKLFLTRMAIFFSGLIRGRYENGVNSDCDWAKISVHITVFIPVHIPFCAYFIMQSRVLPRVWGSGDARCPTYSLTTHSKLKTQILLTW
jgi:hypothetical protein